MRRIVCDKVVCVLKMRVCVCDKIMCVKDCVRQSCVCVWKLHVWPSFKADHEPRICERWCVTKLCVTKLCVTKLCAKDCV